MKKGRLICSLIASKTCQVEFPTNTMFNLIQQAKAKGQSKNKWNSVSSIPRLQQTQAYDGKAMFLRRRISLVLSRLWRSNQKKTLFILT